MAYIQRYVLLLCSILECLLFGGIIFGWSSYVFVLKLEGLYENLCTGLPQSNISNVHTVCEDQDKQLNLLFNIALAVSNCLSAGVGILHVNIGTRNLRLVFTIVMAFGLLLLAFTSKDIPWLFLPGLVACSVAGISFLTASMQISLLLKRGSKMYIGLINGAFDTSIVTMLVLKIYVNECTELQTKTNTEELVTIGVNMLYVFICLASLMIFISIIITLLQTREEKLYSCKEHAIQISKQPGMEIGSDAEKTTSSVTSNSPTLKSLVFSCSFFLESMWFSVFTLQWVFYLGSVNSRLEKLLNDDRKVSDFTNVLGYILFLGILTSFLSGGFQEWQKDIFKDSSSPSKRKYLHLVCSFTIVNILGIILSILGVAQSEHTFYAEFCVIPFYRSFLFSVNMNWVITIFPPKYSGLVYGMFVAISGLFSLLQYPLFNWAQAYDSAFSHVNYMFLCLSAVTLMHPMYILYQGLSCQDPNDSKDIVLSNTFTDADAKGRDNPTYLDDGEGKKESYTTEL